MRQLVTIGDLQRGRGRRRYDALRGIGQTNVHFVPPTQAMFDASTPTPDLVRATIAMLEHFKADGVPSLHTQDPYVLNFQVAFNKDALSANGKLDQDSEYGPNTHDVAVVLASRTPELQPVPDVVGYTSPAGPLQPSKPANVEPAKPAAGGKSVWPWVALGAAAVALYLIVSKRKKRRAGSRAPSVAVFT